MKKIAFTVIALLGLGTASFAQNSYDGVRPTTNPESGPSPKQSARRQRRRLSFLAPLRLRRQSRPERVEHERSGRFELETGIHGRRIRGLSVQRLVRPVGRPALLARGNDNQERRLQTDDEVELSEYPYFGQLLRAGQAGVQSRVQPGIFLSAKIKDNSSGNDETVSVSDLYKGMDSRSRSRKYEFFNRLIVEARYTIGAAQSARLGKIQRSIRYRPQVAEQLFHDFGRLPFLNESA